jgi:branched-subunit amino acid ABC-type transport system permease component
MLSFADTLAILPQQLVFGLTLGTAYGLIAIGYTMVYGVLFMINFAHGDVFMIGAYIGWALLGVLFASHVVPLNPFVVLPLLLVAAMVVTGVLGLLLEHLPTARSLGAAQRGWALTAPSAPRFPAECCYAHRRRARRSHDLCDLPA